MRLVSLNMLPLRILGLLVSVSSQKLFPGHCIPVNTAPHFDRDRYMGLWYEQATIKPLLKNEALCTHYLYKPAETGGFQVQMRKLAKILNGPASIYGFARTESNKSPPGRYLVTYFGDLVNEENRYYVLHTDYDNVAVVWTCDSFYKFWNMQNVHVLTRARSVNTTRVLASALQGLLPNHLDILFDSLQPVDQSECEQIVPT